MSAPMEISFSAPPPPPDAACTVVVAPSLLPASAVSSSPPPQHQQQQQVAAAAAAVVAPSPADDKVLVSVEVLLHATSAARHEDVQAAVERMLEARSLSYVDGPVPIPADNSFLLENVKRIQICDTDEWVENHKVAKLFQKIQEMVEEESNLVFVLIDEVESLAAARQAAISGSEPSDSIRVVNALLTQMDKLKSWPNVIILTTSNITTAIDIAFVDRADIKAYVGPPTLPARYEILRSCIQELLRVGILTYPQGGSVPCIMNYSTLKEKKHCPEAVEPHGALHLSSLLYEAAELCEGLSGRSLRKLPFLAHASVANPSCCDASTFMHTLIQTAQREISESRG
ncbi:Pachytene checkpoint protein 2-like protein [Dichanthelium oligosanthes]|uniref:Pachytene checkpoint protein 2 homolog n=1 Tax=Dichanthelium oligosanthes TaxID=888268 RepID=A0A1E5VQ69_9POAL|nr:Pachytene checkpoint protein 2-like protein [Dichanthelium oligosanthes]